VFARSATVDLLPERREHLYAQFNEFVACQRWVDMNASVLVGTPGRFLGYPPVYGNKHHCSYVKQTFGSYVFYFLSHFLHTPSPSIRKKIAKLDAKYLQPSNCSVGLHIRWGAPEDSFHYVDHNETEKALEAYVSCASRLCPLSEGTVWMLATDSEWVRRQVSLRAPSGVKLWYSNKTVSPDNRHHSRALTEMAVIGMSDHMVTTRLSTFSFAAHARALKRPWVVAKGEAQCKRAHHSQEGLFVGQPVHERWPWQQPQIKRMTCGDSFPDTEGDTARMLIGMDPEP